jgi:hypothetical protein
MSRREPVKKAEKIAAGTAKGQGGVLYVFK